MHLRYCNSSKLKGNKCFILLRFNNSSSLMNVINIFLLLYNNNNNNIHINCTYTNNTSLNCIITLL